MTTIAVVPGVVFVVDVVLVAVVVTGGVVVI